MRRIVIGALVAAAAIAWLAVELGMDPQVLMHYAVTSLLLVLAMAVLALAGAGLLRLLGRLRRRR